MAGTAGSARVRCIALASALVSLGGCSHRTDGDAVQSTGIGGLNRETETSDIKAYLDRKVVLNPPSSRRFKCAAYFNVLNVEVTGERQMGDTAQVAANITVKAEQAMVSASIIPSGCIDASQDFENGQTITVTGELFPFRRWNSGWRIAQP